MPTDDTPNPQPTEPGRDDSPDDLPEVYELETLEQLRAIADELRTRIAEALTHRAMTVTQLGDLLGQAPAKIHYHVRELERVGLIRLVATREKSGILEKYYRAIAKGFTASKTLLSNAPSDETFAAMRSFLDNASRAFLRAVDFTFKNQLWENPKMWGLSATQIWVTHDEMMALMQRVQREFDQYAIPRGVENEEERTVMMMGYDPRVAEELEQGSPRPLQTILHQYRHPAGCAATARASPTGLVSAATSSRNRPCPPARARASYGGRRARSRSPRRPGGGYRPEPPARSQRHWRLHLR